MKNIKYLLAACAVTTLLVWAAPARVEAAQNGFVTAVRVDGQVEYNLGDGLWHPLVQGKVLTQGATVRSIGESSADLVLGREIQYNPGMPHPVQVNESASMGLGTSGKRPAVQQNVVRVLADSTLSVDKLVISDSGTDTVSDTELNLTQGKIFCKVKKLTEASQYLVKIPKGVAGVRGTTFSISVDGKVVCFESTSNGVTISFKGAGGKQVTLVVQPGGQLSPESGTVARISGRDMAFAREAEKTLVTLFHESPKSNSELNQDVATIVVNNPYKDTSTHGE